jgi:type II secretory pathway pseudopilin PulG
MTVQSRRGFTLFQLLAVLAVLAMLVGLLIPAVVRVREAAAKAQSMNNLKQLGLAAHNYHDTAGSFPEGNDGKNYSAVARLLPYIEQDNLFKLIDFTRPPSDKANALVRSTRIPVVMSPRDPQQQVTADAGPTNYLFNAGSQHGLDNNDGVFFQNSAVRLTDITDGTSNTVMTGETLKGDGSKKAVDVRRQHVLLGKAALPNLKDTSGVQEFKDNKDIAGDRCASWLDGRFLQGTFNSGRRLNDARPDVSCDGIGGLSGLRSLNDTFLLGFCDGSVRTFTSSLTEANWKAITTRAGGEVVQFD